MPRERRSPDSGPGPQPQRGGPLVLPAVLVVLLLGLASGPASAQAPLKVYISADMEGLTGAVSRHQTTSSGFEYDAFREIMTAEVNAAIDAALAAGAATIVVSDSHGSGQNLLPLALNPAAELVRGFPRPLDMMQGIDESFDAVFFIGYHASAGRPEGVLAHTSDSKLSSLKLNGVEVSEGGLNAAIAGHFGVPVVMASGDDVSIEELEQVIGDVEGAVVKEAYGSSSAKSLHPQRAQALIRERAAAALADLARFRPWRVDYPVEVEASFRSGSMVDTVATLPGVERVDGDTVRLEAADMLEVAEFVIAVYSLNTGS